MLESGLPVVSDFHRRGVSRRALAIQDFLVGKRVFVCKGEQAALGTVIEAKLVCVTSTAEARSEFHYRIISLPEFALTKEDDWIAPREIRPLSEAHEVLMQCASTERNRSSFIKLSQSGYEIALN